MMKEPSTRRNESLYVAGAEEGWEDEWLAKPPDYPPVRTKGRQLLDGLDVGYHLLIAVTRLG